MSITKITENADDRHPFVIEVQASVCANGNDEFVTKTIQLQAWPNAKYSCLDRMQKMKLQVGAFVLVRCGNLTQYQPKSGDSILQATVFGIQYSGSMSVMVQGVERTILSGRVDSVTANDDGTHTVVMKYQYYDRTERARKDLTCNCLFSAKKFQPLAKVNLSAGDYLAVYGDKSGNSLAVRRAEYSKKPAKA